VQLLLYLYAILNLLVIIFSFYDVNDKSLMGFIFVSIIGLCLALLLLSKNKIKFTRLSLLIAVLFIGGFLMVPISVITNNIIYINYVAGDAILILYLVVILLFFANFRGYLSINKLKNFIFQITIIDFIGWLIKIVSMEGYTSMVPTPFAYCLSFGIFSKKRWRRISFFIFAALSLFINILSTGKINAISYFLILLFTFLIFMNTKTKLEFITTFSIILIGVVGLNIDLIQKLQSSRAYVLLRDIRKSDKHSLSITERLNEIETTYKTMVEISPATFFLGLGHGAVWNRKNYPDSDLRSLERNLTREGFVHNLHIGPVLLIFRYGIFGILTFCCCFYFIGRSIIFIIKHSDYLVNNQQKNLYLILLFLTNILLILMFRWLVMNVLINPLFGFALAFNIYIYNQLKMNLNVNNSGLI
jgi:hypothetical protein